MFAKICRAACALSGALSALHPRLRVVVTWLKFGLLAAALSACASLGNPLTQKTEYDTLMPGWESKFSIQWQAQPEPDGTALLFGRITNHYGFYSKDFRVLGMAVDSSGNVIGQRLAWVHGGVPGFSPVYFEIGPLPAAPSYRVTVWDYTRMTAQQVEAP